MLNTKFKTSISEDKLLLEEEITNYRIKLAIIHRLNQKEILAEQIKLMTILLRIVARLKQGMKMKDAYCEIVTEQESEN